MKKLQCSLQAPRTAKPDETATMVEHKDITQPKDRKRKRRAHEEPIMVEEDSPYLAGSAGPEDPAEDAPGQDKVPQPTTRSSPLPCCSPWPG